MSCTNPLLLKIDRLLVLLLFDLEGLRHGDALGREVEQRLLDGHQVGEEGDGTALAVAARDHAGGLRVVGQFDEVRTAGEGTCDLRLEHKFG